jgi:hypothetical protein
VKEKSESCELIVNGKAPPPPPPPSATQLTERERERERESPFRGANQGKAG